MRSNKTCSTVKLELSLNIVHVFLISGRKSKALTCFQISCNCGSYSICAVSLLPMTNLLSRRYNTVEWLYFAFKSSYRKIQRHLGGKYSSNIITQEYISCTVPINHYLLVYENLPLLKN